MPNTTPTPDDTSSFTPAQLAAYGAAAKLGSGVATYDSRNAVDGPNLPTPAPSKTDTPPVEPTVVTGSNITGTVIPGMSKQADTVSQKGTYVGQDGNMYYSDGSLVPAPTDAEFNNGVWSSSGKSYGAAPQYVNNDSNDPDIAKTNELIAGLKSSLDATTLGSINAIEQQFDILRGQQQDANTRADKSTERSSLLGGAARYAPSDAAGVAIAQTSFGLQQIAKLDADENSAIAQVRQAQQQGDYQLMSRALDVVDEIRKTKQDAATKLADTLSKANDAAAARKLDAMRGDAVAGIMATGVTDPGQIYAALKKSGYDITSDEVAGIVKDLSATTKPANFYTFTNDDIGKLLSAGISAAEAKALQDYYNGKGTMPKLTATQQAALNKVLSGKTTGSDTAFTFTQTQKSQLLSGGFSASDITAMQGDVAKYGIDKVTEGMTDTQKALVKRVLAGTDTVAGVGDDSKLTRDSISKYFGIPDTDDKSGFLGTGATNKASLDSIMATIAKYQAVGYSDADILKMIQDSSK